MFGFHFLVWFLCVRGVRDTQCGFKLFSRPSAQLLFYNQHVERWFVSFRDKSKLNLNVIEKINVEFRNVRRKISDSNCNFQEILTHCRPFKQQCN